MNIKPTSPILTIPRGFMIIITLNLGWDFKNPKLRLTRGDE